MSILSSTNAGRTGIITAKLVSLGMNPSKAVVNPDGTIDYDGDVTMRPVKSGKIPLKLNVIHGNFDCSSCGLTTLEGMPHIVEGEFNCSHNYLTSLVGAPKKAKDFKCSNNLLKSLEGGPKNVTGGYKCTDNRLTNLKGLAKCPGCYALVITTCKTSTMMLHRM